MWLAVVVGYLAQLGLSVLLPILGEVVGRSWAMSSGLTDSWAEHTRDAAHAGWQVTQALAFLASFIAGVLAAYLAPRKPWIVGTVLVALSLLNSVFQQLPSPRSMGILLEWHLAPCLGLVAGIAVCWLVRRGDA